MSDLKHIEYCARLGNTFMKNKLEDMKKNNFERLEKYEEIRDKNIDINSYRNYFDNESGYRNNNSWNNY